MASKSWQRLFLSLFGILVMVWVWHLANLNLYSLPEHSIAAYQAITINVFYVIGSVIIFMVTGRLIYEWKNSTTAAVSTVSSFSETVVREPRPRDFQND